MSLVLVSFPSHRDVAWEWDNIIITIVVRGERGKTERISPGVCTIRIFYPLPVPLPPFFPPPLLPSSLPVTKWLTYKERCITSNFRPHAFKEGDRVHDIKVDFVRKVLDLNTHKRQGGSCNINIYWTMLVCLIPQTRVAYNKLAKVVQKVCIQEGVFRLEVFLKHFVHSLWAHQGA